MALCDPGFRELLTRRLRVRRFHARDAAALVAYRNDPAVARYQDFAALSEADAADQIAAAGHAPGTPGQWVQLAIADLASDALLGDCGLHRVAHEPETMLLGTTLARGAQGQGYASEAGRAVLGYAFEVLRVRRVVAGIDPANAASLRLVERLGFERLAAPAGGDVVYALAAHGWGGR